MRQLVELELEDGLLIVHFRYQGKTYAASAEFDQNGGIKDVIKVVENLFHCANVSLDLLRAGKYEEAAIKQKAPL